MEDRGAPLRGDRLRETTSVTARALDLMLTAVMNKGVGKTRDVGKLTGEAKMNGVVKRTGAWQIRSGSARRSVVASRSVIDLTKTVAEKPLASPRGWLVAAVGSDRGDVSMSQPLSVASLNAASKATAGPDRMGSSVPPSGAGLNLPAANTVDKRVKIGSQDLSLVPNTRIAEIKGGFYELQYTKELCEATPTPGTRIIVADTNQGDESGNGTPKRQRTGRPDSDAGSQCAPPKFNGNNDRNNASHRQLAASICVNSDKITSKRKLFEFRTLDSMVKDTCEEVGNEIDAGGFNPMTVSDKSAHPSDAFAPRAVSPGQASSTASASSSYVHFLHNLSKSGSDKAYMFQKQYRNSDSEGAATSVQYINPGQGVLALAVPLLQHERNDTIVLEGGSQPEADGTQEEPLYQVDNPVGVEANETRTDEYLHPAGGGSQTIRMSSRLISQDLHSIKITDKATKTAAARDVSVGSFGKVIEYDMRIKTGEQEEDDLQLIDGLSAVDGNGVWDSRTLARRIHGDCGAVDMVFLRLRSGVEASVQVSVSQVKCGFSLRLGCFVNRLDEEIRLFDGAIIGESSGILHRSVVSVIMDSWMDLKFMIGSESSTTSAQDCCSFRANSHGLSTQQIKTDCALISVKVTWSTLSLSLDDL
ncbi:hypothetical protein QYE76_044241 [Lolium multiflorum]|uniref:DUF6598 domain-containing protein n=1 Tax=Lolium multiflorum TaxID=4521 RepID=A0AAD8TKN8_LOLMU|nr:hypothetical protein QYE76_044241 [Lolium multiflorum]